MYFIANFALWFLIFITLGRFQELFPFFAPFRLGVVSVAFALVVVLATNTKDLTHFLRSTPISKYFIVILVVAFLGIPFSVYKGPALEEYIDFLRTLLSTSLVVGLGRRNMQSLLLCIISVLLLISIQMLSQKVGGRVNVSSTYDANDIALLCVTYLPFALYGIGSKSKMMKIVSLFAIGGGVASIALSGSRGGLLALIAITIYCIILAKKRRILLIVLCAIGSSIFMAMAGDELWLRMQAFIDGTDYNFAEGSAGRLSIWGNAIEVALRRPILGVGIGQFMTGIGTLTDGPWKASHNTFLQILVELGFLGGGAFLAILYSIYRLSMYGSKASFLSTDEQSLYMYLRVSLLGFCAAGVLLSHAFSPIAYTLFALASVLFLDIKNKEKAAQRENSREREKDIKEDKKTSSRTTRSKNMQNLIQNPSRKHSSQAHRTRHSKKERLEKGDDLFKTKKSTQHYDE